MKTRIILEPEVVLSVEEVSVRPATVRQTARTNGLSKARLDCPPSDEVLARLFRPRTTGGGAVDRGSVPQHILLVEDERCLRDIYTRVLHAMGHLVDAAEDGETAWDSLCATGLDSRTYDLLIADNEIPKLSGVELAQKVRSANSEMPIILFAGAPPANVGPLHLAAILLMPFSQHRLAQAVREALCIVKNE